MIARFIKQPATRAMVFSLIEAEDLNIKRRPSYVPCLSGGQFKLNQDNSLDLKATFSTHDILGSGWSDIYYLRKLQMEFLKKAQEEVLAQKGEGALTTASKRILDAKPGKLYLNFSRAFIDTNKLFRRPEYRRVKTLPLCKKLISALN